MTLLLHELDVESSVALNYVSIGGFEHAWRQAEMGGARAAQVRLSFESLPTLLKNLTPARWTLLEQLKLHRFLPIVVGGANLPLHGEALLSGCVNDKGRVKTPCRLV